MARSMTLQGAVLLVVTTSDVAMRRSALPFHHARFAVYRAIENRRWLIQTSNAGPSFVISPYGDITAETPPWVRTILQGQAGIVRERTLYTQLGDGPLLLLVGCILVFGLLASQRARGRMRWMHGSGAVSGDRPWGTLITTFSGGVLAGLCLATVSIGMLGAGQQGWAAWAESLRTFLRPPVIAIPPAADAEYLQTRSNTCGAAALAYALRLFGADVREGDVLRQVDLHPEGTSMTDLISAARSEGFVAWGEHQNLAALRAVPKPVIAHIRDDHYVVVLSVDGNRVDLFDPAAGYTEMAAEAFSRFWQGNVLMLRVAPLYDPDGATLASGRGS